MKVAIIGLGNMGSGIARNILKAGYELTIWNRTQSKMSALIEFGAKGLGDKDWSAIYEVTRDRAGLK